MQQRQASSPKNYSHFGVTTNDQVSFLVIDNRTGQCPSLTFRYYNGENDDSLASGQTDYRVMRLMFDPPICLDKAEWCLFIMVQDTLVFSTPLYPQDVVPDIVHVLDRTYACFETHQLIHERLEQDDVKKKGKSKRKVPQESEAKHALGIFLQLVNMSETAHGDANIRPLVDMGHTYLPHLFGKNRYKDDTRFFPYNIDPVTCHVSIDPRTIPQRTPLWFKLRQISGTKASKLIGFYVPTKEADPNWSFGKGQEEMSLFQRARMRFGSLSEDRAVIMYLYSFPQRSVTMVGYCGANPKEYPRDWGASPDGLVVDPNEKTSAHGVLEIKSSQKSIELLPYYMPQIYMEMMATNTQWCDLCRYRRSSTYDLTTQTWSYDHVLRVYRIYRDKDMEEDLCNLFRYASDNRDRLQEVVLETPFVEMRQFFQDFCVQLEYEEITPNDELEQLLKDYDTYRNDAMDVQVALPNANALVRMDSKKNQHVRTHDQEWRRVMDNTTKRQRLMAEHPTPPPTDELRALLADQIAQYSIYLAQISK